MIDWQYILRENLLRKFLSLQHVAMQSPAFRLVIALFVISFASRGLAADNAPPPGFTALFNGKDLAGWKGLVENPPKRAKMSADELAAAQAKADEEKMRAHWSVQDGDLVFDGKVLEGYNLCTAKDYGDFELLVDWKIDHNGDSGIYLRGSPQVQIWDPGSKDAKGVGSGGLYNNKENAHDPTAVADKPIGEWNHFRIRMVGDKVTVWLNDQLVTDNVTLENYWERKKPIYSTGAIELQSHKSELRFKNVYVKELPRESEHASAESGAAEKTDLPKACIDGQGPGWVQLAEKDFVNVNCDPDTFAWTDDGVAHCAGKPIGVIRSQKSYKNFEMVAQWKHLQRAGNSGIFVWADPDSVSKVERGKYPKAIELQVLDHGYTEQYEKSTGKKATWFTTNGDLIPVSGAKFKPFEPISPDGSRSFPRKNLSKGFGEWNHYYVRCINGEIRLWVNGEEVSGCSGFDPSSGYVCLESEGAPIEFREIRVRELP